MALAPAHMRARRQQGWIAVRVYAYFKDPRRKTLFGYHTGFILRERRGDR